MDASKFMQFAKAIMGLEGLGNLFSSGALGGSWNFRGGTPSKRHRAKPHTSKKPYNGRACKAVNRPSYKHPDALCARPMPPLHNPGAAYRDARVREIMYRGQDTAKGIEIAISQFNAEPFCSKAEAKMRFAGTFGNHPGMGKRMRAKVARLKRQVESSVEMTERGLRDRAAKRREIKATFKRAANLGVAL